MMQFPPISFPAGFRLLTFEEVLIAISNAIAGSPALAFDFDLSRLPQAAEYTLITAMQQDELFACVQPATGDHFFRVPAGYWDGELAEFCLSGTLFAFPGDVQVPDALNACPLFVEASSLTTFIAKTWPGSSPSKAMPREPTPASSAVADPTQKPFWTLTEALAWIVSGDMALVAGVPAIEAKAQSRGFQGTEAGWEHVNREAARYQPLEQHQNKAVFSAAGELALACADGRVRAHGFALESASDQAVPDWMFCDALLGPGAGGQLSRNLAGEWIPRFLELRFKSRDVLALTPVLPNTADPTSPNNGETTQIVRRRAPGELKAWADNAADRNLPKREVAKEIKVRWPDEVIRPTVREASMALERAYAERGVTRPRGRPTGSKKSV